MNTVEEKKIEIKKHNKTHLDLNLQEWMVNKTPTIQLQE